jgi:hypothetical protein
VQPRHGHLLEDLLDGLNTWVSLTNKGVGLVRLGLLVPVDCSREYCLVPVVAETTGIHSRLTNSTDEGGDQSNTGLGTGDGLTESEEEGQVTVDVVVTLELSGSLDTLPGGSDLR